MVTGKKKKERKKKNVLLPTDSSRVEFHMKILINKYLLNFTHK